MYNWIRPILITQKYFTWIIYNCWLTHFYLNDIVIFYIVPAFAFSVSIIVLHALPLHSQYTDASVFSSSK